MLRSRKFYILFSILSCVLRAQGADKYTDEKRPYEFGFTIDGEQHRHEKKDENGIIMGEFGFITADGVYHVTVYATDENGNFKIISMKNIRVKPYPTSPAAPPTRKGNSLPFPPSQQALGPQGVSPQQPQQVSLEPPRRSCSHCSLPTTSTQAPQLTNNQQYPQDVGISQNYPEGLGNYQGNHAQQNYPESPQNYQQSGILDGHNNPQTFVSHSNPQQEFGVPNYPQGGNGAEQNYPQQGVGAAPNYSQQGGDGSPNSEQNRNVASGERNPKQYNPVSQQQFNPTYQGQEYSPQSSPVGTGFGVQNGQYPTKPTLISAQMQIVDRNTDIYRLDPGEKEGLPNGITKNDMMQLLYTFNYTVGFHGHHEEGYTNGVKIGYYYITGRNGVRTRIDYVADDKGFRPKITQEVLDLLSDEVPKPETEKDEKYGLKGYEFKWLYYPVNS